ncbi:MAG: hypothetical protein RIQ94_743 [Pseudomonadota bacterium]
MQEQGLIAYGDKVIHYNVIRKFSDSSTSIVKAARKVVIKIHPDQRVEATAPHDATKEAIQEAMVKKARWIWQHITALGSQHDHVMPRKYVSGEAQFYLGRRYMLKVLIDSSVVSNVKLLRGQLAVTLRNDSDQKAQQAKALIDEWYHYRAKIIFQERILTMIPQTSWVNEIPSFRILAMKKQWGSCSAKGTLILNPHLVKAPKECIDYVILHEICHIVEHNHSERFWRLLTQAMPNWKEVKARLDNMAEVYLNN